MSARHDTARTTVPRHRPAGRTVTFADPTSQAFLHFAALVDDGHTPRQAIAAMTPIEHGLMRAGLRLADDLRWRERMRDEARAGRSSR